MTINPGRAAIMLLAGGALLAGGVDQSANAQPRSYLDPAAWTIGPLIRGRNYSVGMPFHPSGQRGGGWYIDLPIAPGSVHYVTFRHGSLRGVRRLILRYRVVAAPGAAIVPTDDPTSASIITLYFQRAGDNWSARGPFETYRWYATFASRSPISPGTFEIVAPLDGNWTAVQSSSTRSHPEAFREAVLHADEVGFVLGGGGGYGHGVSATGWARLIVTDFRVE